MSERELALWHQAVIIKYMTTNITTQIPDQISEQQAMDLKVMSVQTPTIILKLYPTFPLPNSTITTSMPLLINTFFLLSPSSYYPLLLNIPPHQANTK